MAGEAEIFERRTKLHEEERNEVLVIKDVDLTPRTTLRNIQAMFVED